MVEEFLDGPEVSLFAITDGDAPSTRCSRPRTSSGSSTATPARTPAAWAPTRRCRGRRPAWSTRCCATVLQPTVDEMARRGTPFSGLLYAGLALTARGTRVVEFNARFGDPETQPLLALLDSPLGELLHGRGHRHASPTCRRRAGRTAPRSPSCWPRAGYPESPSKGDVIVGTETLDREDGRRRHPRRHRPRRRGPPGHRRRAGARRHRGRRRRRRRPRQGLRRRGARSASTAPSTAPTSPPSRPPATSSPGDEHA